MSADKNFTSTTGTLVVLAHQSGAFVGLLSAQNSEELTVTGLCHLDANEFNDWYLVPASVPVGITEPHLETAQTVFQKANMGSMTLLDYSDESPIWKMFIRKWAPIEVDEPVDAPDEAPAE